jgi:hypothetical protein
MSEYEVARYRFYFLDFLLSLSIIILQLFNTPIWLFLAILTEERGREVVKVQEPL